MKKNIYVIFFVLILGMPLCSEARSYIDTKLDETYDLIDNGNYALAMKRFKILAEGSANKDAQFAIGLMYQKGQGIAVDYREAARWYTFAASQQHSGAQNNLYILYINGLGKLKKNSNLAMKWLKKSSDKGSSYAQANLAKHYADGEYVEKDVYIAFDLARKSALHNNPYGRNLLATFYMKGIGVKKNLSKAFSLFYDTANNKNKNNINHQTAQVRIANMYLSGQGVVQSYKNAYIWYLVAGGGNDLKIAKSAKIEADNIEKKLPENVIYDLQEKASGFLNKGFIVNKIKNNKKSNKDKNRARLNAVSEFLNECKEELLDGNESSKCVYKLANSGNIEAQAQLGLWYMQGRVLEKNEERAVFWLTKSAYQEHVDSIRRMGFLHATYGRLMNSCAWFLVARSYGDISVSKHIKMCMDTLGPDEIRFAESLARKIHWDIKNIDIDKIEAVILTIRPDDPRVKNTTNNIQDIINSFLGEKKTYTGSTVTGEFSDLNLPSTLQTISDYIVFEFLVQKSCLNKKINFKFKSQEWDKILHKALRKSKAKYFIENGRMTVYGCS